MKIQTQKFSLATAGISALLYAVCSLFVRLAPDLAMTLMSWLTHSEIGLRQVTLPGLIGGILQVLVYSYIVALIFSTLHNRYTA